MEGQRSLNVLMAPAQQTRSRKPHPLWNGGGVAAQKALNGSRAMPEHAGHIVQVKQKVHKISGVFAAESTGPLPPRRAAGRCSEPPLKQ